MNTAKGEKTKYRLAEALKECMKDTPVKEITIKQIVSLCGVTRQTFYRNFRDLDDLIQWYFNIILEESFRQMGSGETVYDGLVKKFEYIHKEHLFFRAAFSTDRENNLKEHDFHMILDFYRSLIKEKTGDYPDALNDALLEMYCQSSVYMTVKWVLSGMPQSEKSLANLMIAAMPEKLSALFEKLALI
ncbi:MAG: TetR/AcrR family transcriptional regulator C-terminal domain-containing protein [Solobacterium sp.]|nr:TetR/AcrR family transcriptional regulator C-terminal domain-containing protein [Solobacterium sp.]